MVRAFLLTAGFHARNSSQREPRGTGESGHGRAASDFDLAKICRSIELETGKILLVILTDFHGGQKLRVKILRSIAPVRMRIIVDQVHQIVGTDLRHGASHARLTVVIGSDGEGPIAQGSMGLTQVRCRRAGRFDGIDPFVDVAINAHIFFPGGTHELPHAHGAGAGARGDIEG